MNESQPQIRRHLRWRTLFSAEAAVIAVSALVLALNLTVNGLGNEYYTAASWAGSQDWRAWIFGAFDPISFTTIDKPPLATMVGALSVRLFGLSSWSILLPQVAMGVAATGILMATVRRIHGRGAGIAAAIVFVSTPVAFATFRYNNPDALLLLLTVASAHAAMCYVRSGTLRWIVAAGVLVGLGFNAKMLQAYLVLPALMAPIALRRGATIRGRVAAATVLVGSAIVASLPWILLVEATPVDLRPLVGGSTTNSALELTLGLNGLGRIFGTASAMQVGARLAGDPGIWRLLTPQLAGQVSWLLAVTITAAMTILVDAVRARDRARLLYLALWCGWLAVHAAVFSFMSGAMQSHYVVSLAPAIAALVGPGVARLVMTTRFRWWELFAWSCSILVTGAVAVRVVRQIDVAYLRPSWFDVLVLALFAAIAGVFTLAKAKSKARLVRAAVIVGGIASLLGPVWFDAATVLVAHRGSTNRAGPSGYESWSKYIPLDNPVELTPNAVNFLKFQVRADSWALAAVSGPQAAAAELQLQRGVLMIGGFNGRAASPTLERFQDLVVDGKVRFVLMRSIESNATDSGAVPAPSEATKILRWVEASCLRVNLDASAIYDCARLSRLHP